LTARTNYYDDPSPRSPRLWYRGGVLLGAAVFVSMLAGWPRRAGADVSAPAFSTDFVTRTIRDMADRLGTTENENDLLRVQLERVNEIQALSAQYRIPADLSAAIYDIALSELIDPAMAFRLVWVESQFKVTARSPMDAIGLTQVQLATARHYLPHLTEAQLYDRDTNLRIGFRYLRDLLEQFDGNVTHALLAYNRGPTRVSNILGQGGDPANGYARKVTKGDARNSNVPVILN